MKNNVFWFRRDLRLQDNTGLYHALKSGLPVVPIFIFDQAILDKLTDKNDNRVQFIHETLSEIKDFLRKSGKDLQIFYGNPLEVFTSLISDNDIETVYTNHDYEPYAIKRDAAVQALLTSNNIGFNTFKDQSIFEKNEVTKDDGKPYTVFTPYSRKWKLKLTNIDYVKAYPSEQLIENFKTKAADTIEDIIGLEEMDFEAVNKRFPEKEVPQGIIKHYDKTRNFPAIRGTSMLGLHFRYGTISIREKARKALELNETFLNELIWRDFYMMILYHFPHVSQQSFKPAYDLIAWRNNEQEFEQWCQGKTGYPIVDAGMRELNQTGYMHNRVRMIVASFLCKHLLIDWRWGEAYFAKKLLDFDLSANNGGWQWAAGSGCDAAPYFRVFNPYLQTEKFDKDNEYIKKYVPEFESKAYPKPMVEHKFARERALAVYKEGLSKT